MLILKESLIQNATKFIDVHCRRSGSTGFKSWLSSISCAVVRPGSLSTAILLKNRETFLRFIPAVGTGKRPKECFIRPVKQELLRLVAVNQKPLKLHNRRARRKESMNTYLISKGIEQILLCQNFRAEAKDPMDYHARGASPRGKDVRYNVLRSRVNEAVIAEALARLW